MDDFGCMAQKRIMFVCFGVFTVFSLEAVVTNIFRFLIYDALRDLVLFVQFKKREKHPWRSVSFSKVAGLSLQLY